MLRTTCLATCFVLSLTVQQMGLNLYTSKNFKPLKINFGKYKYIFIWKTLGQCSVAPFQLYIIDLPSDLFPSGFPTKMFYVFLMFPFLLHVPYTSSFPIWSLKDSFSTSVSGTSLFMASLVEPLI